MTWWRWLLAGGGLVVAVMLVLTVPSVVRYWKISKM
jgi:hypothetical protein